MKGALAHELTWAYYRMRRHAEHPLRKAVEQTRTPGQGAFQFWRDLRPPFQVVAVKEVDDWHAGHPDGKLYSIRYLCGLDYVSERSLGESSEAGTFDNKIHGEAQARIPDNFPKTRPVRIVSWGQPVLNFQPEEEERGPSVVPPEKWNPLADFLGKRPDSPKLAGVRDACKRVPRRRGVQVPPLQKLLLGPHASLPRLEKVEKGRDPAVDEDQERSGGRVGKRQHRIYTAAAGFISYNG